MMEINSQQILMMIFRIFCFLTTMGLCAFWVYRFSLNEDYSIITYRKFIEKESDTYPTISFCLRDPFLKNRLAEYGTNVSSYLKFLKGDYLTEDMLSIDYKNVTIDIADYVKGYRLYFRNGSITKLDSGLNREEKESLTYISYSGFSGYSNHFSKCFALNIPSIHDLYIFRILLSNSVFPNGIRPSYKGLRIYFHIPQQFLLSESWKMWVWPNRASKESYKMRFLIKSITIMRKRNKDEQKCNQHENDYDDWVIRVHKNRTKCNNPYQKLNDMLPMCTTQEMIRKSYFNDLIAERENLEKPCRTMQALEVKHLESNTNTPDGENIGEFWLSATFSIPTFKEIEQRR